MAMIAYDRVDAGAFAETRHLSDDGAGAWRAAAEHHGRPRAGMRWLDLGAGTGSWASKFTRWFPGLEVVAVEPSAAMRDRCAHRPLIAGDASGIPLRPGTVDAVWMSTVVHHLPDLAAAAEDLRRVLRPGGPVLIRSAFAGRPDGISLFRFFPEAVAVLDTYPGVGDVAAAFGSAGFTLEAVSPVPQVTAASLREAADGLRREAHTPLQLIGDDAYGRGLERLKAAARTATGPVIDSLDLMVLR
jgi:ubiquinone/menaquinone biosynthesis C-methylase UbiE